MFKGYYVPKWKVDKLNNPEPSFYNSSTPKKIVFKDTKKESNFSHQRTKVPPTKGKRKQEFSGIILELKEGKEKKNRQLKQTYKF